MYLNFGKHRRKTTEVIVLKEPDYVLWMLRVEAPTAQLAAAQQSVRRLIERFDEKPIIEPCSGKCGKPATCCTVYHGSVTPRWWCDDCDPSESTFTRRKLTIVRRYGDAVWHVGESCNSRKQDLKLIIRELARAKGLPDRVGEEQAAAFFC